VYLLNSAGADMTTRIPLRCACCRRPFAELQQTATGAYVLVILAKHEGQWHTNVLTAAGLEALLMGEGIQAVEDVVA
jgi:hypothetical protein